ncbi:SDR family oxidoreductase [Cohnella thailandensis]|uniref:SDR family oxidoreductase n=1 Tax=Cohnella thailandensis TaxID=557557 RepID=A0A841ST62_9BACL|nr:SDR family oxidoreductase [Cohnella thailandensis]MBB6632817.1 SDR family oxidoreductase [Cohnella thailandensis]MBP1975491.1 nucleoside-diphosphate-sugar epimerase [Cohnella thailandensis]
MRVFVTGATGYVGTAVVRELIDAGHRVVGLARSDKGAAALMEAGAEAIRGAVEDLDILRGAAADADGVIHLAFTPDFSKFAEAQETDLLAIQAMGAALEGTGKPLAITVHVGGESSINEAVVLAGRGVRTSIVALSPSVHGEGDKAFVPRLIHIARAKGFSAYVGDGTNRWPAVHRFDAANLYRLALEKAPAGSMLYGRAEEGVAFRDIAEVIGRYLNVPTVSLSREEAEAHFGMDVPIAGLDIPSLMPGSGERTKELLGWNPVHSGLIEDLEQGHYFNE